MKRGENKGQRLLLCGLGLIPIIWLGLLIAPYAKSGLLEIIRESGDWLSRPFSFTWCEDSLKTVLLLILLYALIIGVLLSSERNYRKREEHGSAKWGDAGSVNRKHAARKSAANKLLTRHVAIGMDGRKHKRNLNVLVCGGSGSGKTRFYAKPNIMQAENSLVILDPKRAVF